MHTVNTKIWMVRVWIKAPFIHLNLSPFRFFLCRVCAEHSKTFTATIWYYIAIVLFDIDIRTVELFSRQSIFIMSIAIYSFYSNTWSRNDFGNILGILGMRLGNVNVCVCVRACSLFFVYASAGTQFCTSMSKITIEMNYNKIYQLIGFSVNVQSPSALCFLYTIHEAHKQ